MIKKGKLISNGVKLYPHERKIVEYFLERGEDIELIRPRYTIGDKNADFVMRRKIWEAKSPRTENKNTLEVTFKRAVKQSENVIIDLRSLRDKDGRVLRLFRRRFSESNRIKNLLLITKNGGLVCLKKK